MSLHIPNLREPNLTASTSSTSPAILDETRIQAIETLDSWNFEPSKLPEEEVLVCTITLFEALLCKEGMEDEIGISLGEPLSPSSLYQSLKLSNHSSAHDLPISSSRNLSASEFVSQLSSRPRCPSGCPRLLIFCWSRTPCIHIDASWGRKDLAAWEFGSI